MIFDELIILVANFQLLAVWKHVLRSKQMASTENIVYTLLFSALTSHLFAIRQLVLLGFDIDAKAITRLLLEYVDLFHLLFEKPELCVEFHQAQSLTEANKFWHKYVSKGKLRSHVDAAMKKAFEGADQDFEQFRAWRQQELQVLSGVSHASFMGAYLSAANGGYYRREGSGAFGNIDLISIRTLRIAVVSIGEFLLVNGKRDFIRDLRFNAHADVSFAVEYIYGRQKFVIDLLLYVFEKEGGAKLRMPRQRRAKKTSLSLRTS